MTKAYGIQRKEGSGRSRKNEGKCYQHTCTHLDKSKVEGAGDVVKARLFFGFPQK